jgi:hypothetical protein
MSAGCADELYAGYEALRATMTGSAPASAPRGLALLMSQGLPCWMRAFARVAPPAPQVVADERTVLAGLAGEVVRLLTEMALAGRARLVVS